MSLDPKESWEPFISVLCNLGESTEYTEFFQLNKKKGKKRKGLHVPPSSSYARRTGAFRRSPSRTTSEYASRKKNDIYTTNTPIQVLLVRVKMTTKITALSSWTQLLFCSLKPYFTIRFTASSGGPCFFCKNSDIPDNP